ncbi:MAG: OmpH family outer membrane protein [Verrucomicrobiae bacterium]|nr:OmpH family outer membrane protein [Verrucomicrobiae bacterium]
MMRQLKLWCSPLLMLGAMAWGISGVAMAENPKMATVDMQKLFKGYHRAIAAQKRFDREYSRIQIGEHQRAEAMNRIRRMLQSLVTQLKQDDLSDELKMSKQQEGLILNQELQMLRDELRTFSKQEKQKVDQMKAASMQGLMQEIRMKVEDVSKQQRIDFVFDTSGKNTNQVSFFLYLKDAKEITAKTLKELNASAPSGDGN